MLSVAVLGYGTVGSGVVEVFEKNKKEIARNIGEEVNVKYVLDLRDFPGDPIQEKVTHDYNDVLNDPDIKVVIEVMGGTHPAYDFSMSALKAGKSVCTSNKELVEKHGTELIKTAKENNVNYLFEASVGGGIPIIRTLTSCLTSDRIEEIEGIINGTTNYMLTKMYFEGADYDEVLKEAQKNGYAELHPEADVEGYDACRKIAILSSIISGHEVNFEDIYCEGITEISQEDISYAKAMGLRIKLIARTRAVSDSLCAMVAPFMMSDENPLFSVNGVFNALFVRSNMLGDSMYYGSGAGKLPTASAVCADAIEALKNPGRTLYENWDDETLKLVPVGDMTGRFFVRMKGEAKALRDKIESLFGCVTFIENIVNGEFGFVTDTMSEASFKDKTTDLGEYVHMLRIID